uniref:BZIP domain-containing protein n=1 Tax=Nelumbo nucifera TaxID=4432 RepID=A0A822ZTJ1_NELNU|nr:TPA_asm: hypothetical protein HUJ06_018499 [Nelumbo nucifera]
MVVPESEARGRVEVEITTAKPPEEVPKTHSLSSLGRQSSIYSLTLDEFQHTLCENGKSFGSMNMDEFLNNIWTAEENQAIGCNNERLQSNPDEAAANRANSGQPSVLRQGSITLPAPLCHKTVDEVWAEIHKHQERQQQEQQPNNGGNPGTTQRQLTFGEMTLEDFLIRAGIVREACGPSSKHQLQTPATVPPTGTATQQYGLYQNNNAGVDPNFGMGPLLGLGFSEQRSTGNGVANGVLSYQTFPQSGTVLGEPSNYAPNGKRNGGFPATVCFGGRTGNGAGYVAAAAAANTLGPPVCPVTSEGMCTSQVDNATANQYGVDISGIRGRKRLIDSPVEKVVERRQRRMIKNRESAARSRARKQAYTVELEAELNHLKEENGRLKEALLLRRKGERSWKKR